jgi:O-antigen/teichoic acid export membrane protein
MSGLTIKPKAISRSSLMELWRYGGRSMAVNLSVFIVYRTDLLVIGAFLGPKWVTIYAIGQLLVSYLSNAVSAITHSFTPRMTQLASQGADDELKQAHIMSTWVTACLLLPVAGCLVAFGSQFIALWLDSEYVSGSFWVRSDAVLVILLAAQLPRMLQSSSWQLLFATRQQGYLAKLTGFEAILNITLSIILVQQLGIAGVALGTLVPMWLTHVLLLPRYIKQSFGVTVRESLARPVAAPALVAVILWGFGELLSFAVAAKTWALFIVETSLTTVVGIVLIYVLVLDDTAKRDVSRFIASLRGKA